MYWLIVQCLLLSYNLVCRAGPLPAGEQAALAAAGDRRHGPAGGARGLQERARRDPERAGTADRADYARPPCTRAVGGVG